MNEKTKQKLMVRKHSLKAGVHPGRDRAVANKTATILQMGIRCALLIVLADIAAVGCAHSAGRSGATKGAEPSRALGPGGVATLKVSKTDCEIGPGGQRANDADFQLAIDAAVKLASLLRNNMIPEPGPREAAAQGLPLVETVWARDDHIPLVGPGHDAKPYPAFVSLTVAPDNDKCTEQSPSADEAVEFLRISVNWAVVGGKALKEKQSDTERVFYEYGVRLGRHRGQIFFRGKSFATIDSMAKKLRWKGPTKGAQRGLELGPGGVEVLKFGKMDCNFGPRGRRANDVDFRLAIEAAVKLASLLRNDTIPESGPREAAAQGLPIVETVWGGGRVPVVGPRYDAKPYPAFVSLRVVPGNTVCTGQPPSSDEATEFLIINVNWEIVGGKDVKREQSDNQRVFYEYGVRLGQRRGEIFFRDKTYTYE